MYGVLMIDIDNTTLTAEDVSLIKQAQVGGVILFGRNVADATQVRALCDDIRYHNPDILIGVDQAGAGIDHRQRARAEHICIGAAKGHRRGVRRQHPAQPGRERLGVARNRLEVGLGIDHLGSRLQMVAPRRLG